MAGPTAVRRVASRALVGDAERYARPRGKFARIVRTRPFFVGFIDTGSLKPGLVRKEGWLRLVRPVCPGPLALTLTLSQGEREQDLE